MNYDIDELSVYRGRDVPISEVITVYQPCLGEIEEFGEQRYFSAVHLLTSVGADLKWQLFDAGIDYMKIKDYDLFVQIISQLLSSGKNQLNAMSAEERASLSNEDLAKLTFNPMSLILKGFDFADYVPWNIQYPNKPEPEIVLYNPKDDKVINRAAYFKLVDVIRDMHGLKRNNEIPANEATKMDMIEDARDEFLASKAQPYKSMLKPLISTMRVVFGCCDDSIWDMKIGAFFDSVKRDGVINDSKQLLNGAYSGAVNLKKINKERLNYFRRLN